MKGFKKGKEKKEKEMNFPSIFSHIFSYKEKEIF